jgi:hypothetical protein
LNKRFIGNSSAINSSNGDLLRQKEALILSVVVTEGLFLFYEETMIMQAVTDCVILATRKINRAIFGLT